MYLVNCTECIMSHLMTNRNVSKSCAKKLKSATANIGMASTLCIKSCDVDHYNLAMQTIGNSVCNCVDNEVLYKENYT